MNSRNSQHDSPHNRYATLASLSALLTLTPHPHNWLDTGVYNRGEAPPKGNPTDKR